MDPPDTWTGLWAPPLPFCLEPGIVGWTGFVSCCLCSSNLIYFILQEYTKLLWAYLCCGKGVLVGSGERGPERGRRMISVYRNPLVIPDVGLVTAWWWCFKNERADVWVYCSKKQEQFHWNCFSEVQNGFSEVQKLCVWKQNHTFELLGFRKEL